MLDIRVDAVTVAEALALPVRAGTAGGAALVPTDWVLAQPVLDEVRTFLTEVEYDGAAGTVHHLPRPGRSPANVLLVGVGEAGAEGWRAAGAAVARAAASRLASVTVPLPADPAVPAAEAFAEAAWLATYRFRFGEDANRDGADGTADDSVPGTADAAATSATRDACKLREITLATRQKGAEQAVARTRRVVEAVVLARDLTNMPSERKSPQWFAERIRAAAAGRPVRISVLDEVALAERGFGGILAIGAGSTRPPRLVELAWEPPDASRHVVLAGKGITFDSGGISIKPRDAMKLMRRDMSGAATVLAATLAAADLRLPVRITALAPLAENMVSGSSVRPGDVVRHYGGLTTEVQNTDAEGRVVLGDVLAYAADRLRPDVIVDLATLTGASRVALGKRIAALFTPDDALAEALAAAAGAVGEPMWRMPLVDEYTALLASDVADLNNAPGQGLAGAVLAALYLREFTGAARQRWAHIDMAGPSWSETHDGILVKGATGWGVRMLVRWLATV